MSYPGSKGQSGTYQLIIGQMPPHHSYIEAFYGGGKIFRTKRPAMVNVAVDKLRRVLPEERFEPIRVQPVCDDAISWLERTLLHGPDDSPETLIYCDPPYLLSTRQGRFYYDHEMTDDQHRDLLAILCNLESRVLISGYPSQMYSRMLADWRCISYRTRTRGRTVTECLWCNFPEPAELHDWRFAGKNFRQRLSLKRLASRWLARLQEMPPLKRGYLLDAIEQRHPRPESSKIALAADSARKSNGGHHEPGE